MKKVIAMVTTTNSYTTLTNTLFFKLKFLWGAFSSGCRNGHNVIFHTLENIVVAWVYL